MTYTNRKFTWDFDALKRYTRKYSPVYDVTAYNDGATFDSLKDLLSSESLDTLIPADYRKGGMSIKFVHTSDNKYVQYRLMAQTFSTTESDWQGVDDEPTAGSKNLVESGGVFAKINDINHDVSGHFTKDIVWSAGYVDNHGVIKTSSLSQFSQPLLLKAGEKITVGTASSGVSVISSTNANSVSLGDTVSVIQLSNQTAQFENYSYVATEDIKIVVCVLASNYTITFENTKCLDNLNVDELNKLTNDAPNSHNLALVNGSVPLLSGSAFVDTGETYNGQPIWRLTSSSDGYTGTSGYYTELPKTTPVNTKLKVAFKAKKASSEGANNVWVRFYLNSSSGREYFNVENLTDDWKQIILDFTVDTTMSNTKTSLRWGKPSGSYLTDVYITDIVLYYDNEDFYPSNIIPPTIERLEKGIEDNTESISQINNEVSGINRKVEKGSIIYRNEDINDAIGAAGYYYVGQTKKKFLQLLVGADIHGDNYQYGTFQERPMPSMVDYLNGITNIDAGIMLGDIVYYNFSDSIDFYVNAIANAEKPFLTVIGNHDAGLYADPDHSYDTVADLYNKMIAPTIQYAVLEPGEFTSGNTYYFKDFADYKVRIIVLNQYEYPDSKTEFPRGQKTMISQSQINWLIATLGSAPADYHIVIALHSSPSPSMLSKESKFTSNMYSEIAAGHIFGQDSFISGDIIPDIVNAWVNGTSLNESYTVTSATGTVSSLSVAADFTLRGIGKFAGYIGGHWHSSVISCVNQYQTQKLYSTDCSALRNQAAYGSDMPRLVNTKSQDCYAVVTIDTVNNWIKITKVGARYTEDMTERFITKI